MKCHISSALAAVFSFILAPAWAQVTIAPSKPQYMETVHITAPTTALPEYNVNGTRVSMIGNSITVSVPLPSIPLGIPYPPLDVVVGQLPAGSYDVTVNTVAVDGVTTVGTLGTAHFTVAARDFTKFTPPYDYSDHWWNPSESGWGIVINQHISSNIVAAWFVYGGDGKPIWYVIPGGSWQDGIFAGTVYKTTGPYFGGTFDPSKVSTTQAGSATLAFKDFGHATFSYTVDGVTGVKQIERLPY